MCKPAVSHYNKGRQGQAAIAICLTFHGPGGCSGFAGRCCGPEGQPMGVQGTISPPPTILAHNIMQMLTASVIAAAVPIAFALGGFRGSSSLYSCVLCANCQITCVLVGSRVRFEKPKTNRRQIGNKSQSNRTCDLTDREQIAVKSHMRFDKSHLRFDRPGTNRSQIAPAI